MKEKYEVSTCTCTVSEQLLYVLLSQKLKEDYQRIENEKTEIETELLKKGTTSSDAEVMDTLNWVELILLLQVASLKRMKRELEAKVEELEDEVDDLNIKVDSLQQVNDITCD